jgi:hypothetical protein
MRTSGAEECVLTRMRTSGAEEFNWLGAHGFISSSVPLQLVPPTPNLIRRPLPPLPSPRSESILSRERVEQDNTWAASVRALVNLEAIGSGGRPFLMRTTPGAGRVKG